MNRWFVDGTYGIIMEAFVTVLTPLGVLDVGSAVCTICMAFRVLFNARA